MSTMPSGSFWKARRVLLTGHTGFKGSWLTLWLNVLGANVTGYALKPPTHPNLFEQVEVTRSVRSVYADVRDFPRLKAAVAECCPEVIIHMAAQSVVRRSYEDPVETYSSNVMGTVHLLEAIRQIGQECVVVIVTSDKCYADREWVWGYRETERLGGRDPYSSSKACAELITDAYRKSFFPIASLQNHRIALATARAGNVIGGGDWTSDQLIPDIIRAFLAGKPCLIRSPTAIRPWQFVLEPLRGYLLLAERLAKDGARFCSAWNFGPAEAEVKPVSWIADELTRLWGNGASWQIDNKIHPHETHYLKLDACKAKEFLDWTPLLPLNLALNWIADWYLAYQAGHDLRRITETQIKRYEALPHSMQADRCLNVPVAAQV